ncbi:MULTISPECIES: DUF4893 domain-containing protein [Sphingomonas]|uniref:DUF4893 domain-containing protein n=1 Tax=Sphingomonas TaxID=13687 RepID=UPI000DEF2D27|nr:MULTISPECIES: DUF4893 domain-containing protein [Sphingomonas]
MTMKLAPLGALLALTACQTMAPNAVVPQRTADWQRVVTPADRGRLRDWRRDWLRGLDQATKAGHGAEIAREGVLLQPDAALPGSTLPNGDYRCRTIKLGAKSAGMLPYIAYPAFRCRVGSDGQLQSLAKVSGSQRPVGGLYPADQMRSVFLGTLVLGDERRALVYGQDHDRDVVGFVERIGPQRWRLVMPAPTFESLTDVMELVPA